jgi:hypothetical protein
MQLRVLTRTIRHGYEGRGNAAILQLGSDACTAFAAAQSAPPAQRARLLAQALELRQQELRAWTAFCTPEMPNGDQVGQSMACMGIANVHFLSHELDPLDTTNSLEQARHWYARADACLEEQDSSEAAMQRETIRGNSLQFELFAATRLLHKEVRVRGLTRAVEYNGRLGQVVSVVDPGKYEVRLASVDAAPEAILLVHERHLQLV